MFVLTQGRISNFWEKNEFGLVIANRNVRVVAQEITSASIWVMCVLPSALVASRLVLTWVSVVALY